MARQSTFFRYLTTLANPAPDDITDSYHVRIRQRRPIWLQRFACLSQGRPPSSQVPALLLSLGFRTAEQVTSRYNNASELQYGAPDLNISPEADYHG
jgi:hypothetical protein